MSLETELIDARKQIVKDGYDMSFGELMSLYKEGELIINPEYQRYFRWNDTAKTRFVESILLGIPIPPLFVYQIDNGKWELVDGLQRLSTVLQFAGILKTKDDGLYPPLMMAGTRLLPSLEGKTYTAQAGQEDHALTPSQQIDIKRARVRIEILKKGSDPSAKYELFQRLNTGGASLSEQEVRNCTLVMMNRELHALLSSLSDYPAFNETVKLTEAAELKRDDLELVLRFFVYRLVPYRSGLDIHEYLDDGMLTIAAPNGFPATEESVFKTTFDYLAAACGNGAFKRFEEGRYLGKFMTSAYEVVAIGVSRQLPALAAMQPDQRSKFLESRVKALWANQDFGAVGAGVRGTQRLPKMLKLAEDYFRP